MRPNAVRTALFVASVCCARALPAGAQSADYLNESLPLPVRVHDLVTRMTLAEKISQMKDVAPAIDRLGVPGL